MGFDMPILSGGIGLSGGQRQLVALARALVTRPKVLLMDEPTSAMDMQSEAQFTQRLDSIVANRTVIIVTHRPSLLKVVDRIVVMDNQRMVADGPKEKILAMLSGSSAVSQEGPALERGEH
jgi:ATP-binding cassette subfamily C protein LapB